MKCSCVHRVIFTLRSLCRQRIKTNESVFLGWKTRSASLKQKLIFEEIKMNGGCSDHVFVVKKSWIVLILTFWFSACATISPEPQQVTSKEGCSRPAVLSGIPDTTIELASLGIKDVTVGGFKYQNKPQLVNAFSEMSKDTLVIDYQVCLAINKNGYSGEQAEWLRSQLLFMRTNPSPEQADRWLTGHPFPAKGAVRRGRAVIDGRNETNFSGGGGTVTQESKGDFSPNNYGSGSVTIIREK